VNISSEVILGVVTAAGAILSGAVAKMWIWFTGELKECKEERKDLYKRVEEMHGQVTEVSTKVALLEQHVGDRK